MADVDEVASADWQEERLYKPLPGEAQLTARAVIAGCLIGSVVSCTNIYIGLKIGLAVSCENFEKHLITLKSKYKFVSMDMFLENLENKLLVN